MDMYQKREERKKSKVEEQNQTKTNINWDNPTKGQLLSNLYKISISVK